MPPLLDDGERCCIFLIDASFADMGVALYFPADAGVPLAGLLLESTDFFKGNNDLGLILM